MTNQEVLGEPQFCPTCTTPLSEQDNTGWKRLCPKCGWMGAMTDNLAAAMTKAEQTCFKCKRRFRSVYSPPPALLVPLCNNCYDAERYAKWLEEQERGRCTAP